MKKPLTSLDIDVNVNINVSVETAEKCVMILNMFMKNNPGFRLEQHCGGANIEDSIYSYEICYPF